MDVDQSGDQTTFFRGQQRAPCPDEEPVAAVEARRQYALLTGALPDEAEGFAESIAASMPPDHRVPERLLRAQPRARWPGSAAA